MILYEGQPNIIELCERFGLELTPYVTFGAELPALLFGDELLDQETIGAAFAELGGAHEQTPPVPLETLAAWVRRTGLSATPHAFLEALIQIQPSIPLRYVDAHTLHLGPEVFMQIAGGNDQLPRRIAEGLDVRLGQPVRTIGWSGSGVTVETETETLSGDLVVAAVPGPLTTELGWDPPLPPEKVGALVSLRYGTGAGVGIQYAETDVIREAIQTGIFTDRLPNWFLDVSAYQSGQPIVVVTILSAERQPRGLDEAAVLEEADRTMAMVTGSPVTRTHGTVVSWTDDPYSRCIARAPDRRPARDAAPADQGAAGQERLLRRRAHGRPPRAGRDGRSDQVGLPRGGRDPRCDEIAPWASQPNARPGSGRPSPASRTRRCCAARAASWTTSTRCRNAGHAAILRSQLAHARIVRLDASAALEHPGVVGVLTGADVAAMSTAVPGRRRRSAALLRGRRPRGRPLRGRAARGRRRARPLHRRGRARADRRRVRAARAGARRRAAARSSPTARSRTATSTPRSRAPTSSSPSASTFRAGRARRSSATASSPTGTRPSGVLTAWANFQGPFTLHSVAAAALGLPGLEAAADHAAELGRQLRDQGDGLRLRRAARPRCAQARRAGALDGGPARASRRRAPPRPRARPASRRPSPPTASCSRSATTCSRTSAPTSARPSRRRSTGCTARCRAPTASRTWPRATASS